MKEERIFQLQKIKGKKRQYQLEACTMHTEAFGGSKGSTFKINKYFILKLAYYSIVRCT